MPSDGIDINFCRNPYCENFGLSERHDCAPPKGRPSKGAVSHNRYKLAADSKKSPVIICLKCGQGTRVKSNIGVAEERLRLASYLIHEDGPSCPSEDCDNHGRGVLFNPDLYRRHGHTAHGSQRYRCRLCGTSVTVGKTPITKQKRSHVNRMVMSLLTNGVAMRRVAKIAGIDHKTVYDKLTFLHRQCIRFVRNREWRLTEMDLPPLFLCSDKQDYYTNWVDSEHRENTRLTAVGTSDLDSGYVFGMDLNFVHDLSLAEIEADTRRLGEHEWAPPYRRYGHYWLTQDMDDAKGRPRKASFGGTIERKVIDAAEDTERRGREELVEDNRGLPAQGVQVRQEYTAFAQYHLLAGLLHNSPHITLYLDQDSDLRSAALVTFQARIRNRSADIFFVKIEKDFTNKKKADLAKRGYRYLAKFRQLLPDMNDAEIRQLIMRRRIERRIGTVVPPYNDLWIRYPFPRKSEPEKAVCYLTDYACDNIERKAQLHLKASLHAVDRFFMQVRRAISLVERPITSPANASRVWQGKNAYNPHVIQKLLGMYRVVFNYVEVGADDMTPAMRLGLAQAPIGLEDIIYFDGR